MGCLLHLLFMACSARARTGGDLGAARLDHPRRRGSRLLPSSRWRSSATCATDFPAGPSFEVSLSRPCSSLPRPWTFDGILPHIVRGSMGRLVFLDSRPCIYAAGLPVFRST